MTNEDFERFKGAFASDTTALMHTLAAAMNASVLVRRSIRKNDVDVLNLETVRENAEEALRLYRGMRELIGAYKTLDFDHDWNS